jgi:hypothetical protein
VSAGFGGAGVEELIRDAPFWTSERTSAIQDPFISMDSRLRGNDGIFNQLTKSKWKN